MSVKVEAMIKLSGVSTMRASSYTTRLAEYLPRNNYYTFYLKHGTNDPSQGALDIEK